MNRPAGQEKVTVAESWSLTEVGLHAKNYRLVETKRTLGPISVSLLKGQPFAVPRQNFTRVFLEKKPREIGWEITVSHLKDGRLFFLAEGWAITQSENPIEVLTPPPPQTNKQKKTNGPSVNNLLCKRK